jgi:hypothetical protein
MLEIIHPLALVASAIYMNVHALSIGLIVDPVSLIYIPVNVGEFTETMCSVVLPVSFVTSPIRPDLLSVSVAESTDPLSRILCSSRVLISWSLLALCVRVVRHI